MTKQQLQEKIDDLAQQLDRCDKAFTIECDRVRELKTEIFDSVQGDYIYSQRRLNGIRILASKMKEDDIFVFNKETLEFLLSMTVLNSAKMPAVGNSDS